MPSTLAPVLPLLAALSAAGLILALGGAGDPASAWVTLALVGGAAIVSLVQVGTRNRERTRLLDAERRRIDAILRAIPSLVAVQEPGGTFLSANPALVAHYGAAHEAQLVGKLPRASSLHAVDAAFEQVLSTGTSIELVRESTARDGTVSTFNCSLLPFELLGGGTGVLNVATDISEMRAVHRSLSDAMARALAEYIPMCAGCRKVRVEDAEAGPDTASGTAPASWDELEDYVTHRTSARFSHTFCPECAMRLYGEHLFDADSTGARDGEGSDGDR